MIGRLSDIDVRLLRNFVAVVEAGGFSLATARLNVSESTISQQMSDLESRLGMRLCERGRAGFRLTRNGEEVYKATVELLEDMTRFRDRLALLGSEMSGTLNLGVADAIVTHPGSQDRRSHPAPMSTAAPTSRSTSICSRRASWSAASSRASSTSRSRRSTGASPGSPTCRSSRAELALLRPRASALHVPQEAITPEMLDEGGRIARGYLEHFDKELFGTERYRATVQLTEAAALLILSGRFIGFLPDHYAAGWVAEGRMKAIRPDRYRLEPRFSIISRRDATADRRVDAFVKEIIRLSRDAGASVEQQTKSAPPASPVRKIFEPKRRRALRGSRHADAHGVNGVPRAFKGLGGAAGFERAGAENRLAASGGPPLQREALPGPAALWL